MQTNALDQMANPNKRLIVMRSNEGASGQAGRPNIPLVTQLAFDWLDEVLVRVVASPVGGGSMCVQQIPGTSSTHRARGYSLLQVASLVPAPH